jgi:hypothetical protein
MDEVFANDYYLVDLNYQEILNVLYNFGDLETRREEATRKNQDLAIKIASSIKKLDPKRKEFYRKPIVSSDRKRVDYLFEKIFIFIEDRNSNYPKYRDVSRKLRTNFSE